MSYIQKVVGSNPATAIIKMAIRTCKRCGEIFKFPRKNSEAGKARRICNKCQKPCGGKQ